MSAFAEYADHDGLGLADLVRRKEVSAAELLEACLARIDALNPALGCVVARFDDLARVGQEVAARASWIGRLEF